MVSLYPLLNMYFEYGIFFIKLVIHNKITTFLNGVKTRLAWDKKGKNSNKDCRTTFNEWDTFTFNRESEMMMYLIKNYDGYKDSIIDHLASLGMIEIIEYVSKHEQQHLQEIQQQQQQNMQDSRDESEMVNNKEEEDKYFQKQLKTLFWKMTGDKVLATPHAIDNATAIESWETVLYLSKCRREGCSTEAIVNTIKSDNFDMFKYLYDSNKDQISTTKLLRDSVSCRDRVIYIQYILEDNMDIFDVVNTLISLEECTNVGNLEVFKLLYTRFKYPISSLTKIINVLNWKGFIEIVKYLFKENKQQIVLPFTTSLVFGLFDLIINSNSNCGDNNSNQNSYYRYQNKDTLINDIQFIHFDLKIPITGEIMENAVNVGTLELLLWYHNNSKGVTFSENAVERAVRGSFQKNFGLDILKFLSKVSPESFTQTSLHYSLGDIRVLKDILLQNDTLFTLFCQQGFKYPLEGACSQDDGLEIIKLLVSYNMHRISEESYGYVALHNRHDILQYLMENQLMDSEWLRHELFYSKVFERWDMVDKIIAIMGNTTVNPFYPKLNLFAQSLLSKKCLYSRVTAQHEFYLSLPHSPIEFMYRDLVHNGHTSVAIQWIKDMKISIDEYRIDDNLMNVAILSCNMKVVQFLLQEFQWKELNYDSTMEIIEKAAFTGDLDIMVYLLDNLLCAKPLDSKVLMTACRLGHVNIVDYLLEHHQEVFTSDLIIELEYFRGCQSFIYIKLMRAFYQEEELEYQLIFNRNAFLKVVSQMGLL